MPCSHLLTRLLAGGCAALVSACAVLPPSDTPAAGTTPSPATAASSVPSPSAAAQLQYHVMLGEMAADRQQPEQAAEEFLKALALKPDARLAARATALAIGGGREDLALKAAQIWQQSDPDNLDARETVARLDLRAGNNDETLAECQSIVKDHPGGVDEGLRHVALLLAQEPAHAAAAFAVMDRLVAAYPDRPGAQTARALLALRLERPDLAEQDARAALRLDPHSRDATLLLIGALTRQHRIPEATELLEGQVNQAKTPKESAELRLGFARMLIDTNARDAAHTQLKKALELAPDNDDARLALGLIALESRHLDEAQAQFEILAKSPSKQNEGNYFLGRIDELRNQPQQALDHYQKVTGGSQAFDALLRRGALLGKLRRIDEAKALFAGLRDRYPQLAEQLYAAEGDMLVNAGRADDALALYTRALSGDPGNRDLLYSRALTYDRLGKSVQAEEDLRKLIAGAPRDARALNALGYLLTQHGSRYDEARQLIARALELAPNDPAVIDSMGWVEFKLGHLDQALPLLQRAYELFPDPEIAAHLGEVLWARGDKPGARAVWDQALKRDPDNPTLRTTIQRLGR